MNKNTLEKLNYYELKEIVKEYCVSSLGKTLIDKLQPSNDLEVVNKRLDETSEGRKLIDASCEIPLEGVYDVLPYMREIENGKALEPEELVIIADFLRACKNVKTFMLDMGRIIPNLSSYAQRISDLSYIEDEINICVKDYIIDSNVNRELRKIRRRIEKNEDKIKNRLQKFLNSSENQKYIEEFSICKRKGKYTVAIKSDYKESIDGNIIENSDDGSIVYMELDIVSKYASELSMLKVEENIEEYEILGELSEMIKERMKDLKNNIDIMAEYDMIWAKAKYSKDISGIKPKINNNGYIKIVDGKYALLENGVPLNFEIGQNFRSLIITGPNAGGKTVVLKTVGLFTLAIQSGIHISAKEGTEISIFNEIFAEIGDNQNIENALSTFSAHVKNLAEIINEASKSSLLLFDEIGSGTEPNEGAAFAIAILEDLYHKGCITVATTHYGEIKNFSEEHDDFENAAMEFKKDTLEPLYKLHIGKTGDSNALYIAEKMGMPESIINRTKEYIETKAYNYKLIDKTIKTDIDSKIESKIEDTGFFNTIYEYLENK